MSLFNDTGLAKNLEHCREMDRKIIDWLTNTSDREKIQVSIEDYVDMLNLVQALANIVYEFISGYGAINHEHKRLVDMVSKSYVDKRDNLYKRLKKERKIQ